MIPVSVAQTMIEYNLLTDEDLVKSIQENHFAEKCLNILIDRHSGLCIEMITSYVSKQYNESLRLEMIKDKDLKIYQAALKFDSSKNAKFSTYLANDIKWQCLNNYNRDKKRKLVPVEENLINYLNYHNQDQEDEPQYRNQFNQILSKAKSHRDKRVGRIFHLRYEVGKNNSVMPWKYISKDLGMSIQGCINIHDAAIRNLKHNINKYE